MPASSNPNSSVCFDMGCRIILVNRTWLMKKNSRQKISIMLVLLKVKSIGIFKYKLGKFALIVLYILGFGHDGTKIYMYIKCKLYLVKGLKANILIDNDILYIKGFLINFLSAFTLIQGCNIDIIINAKYHLQYLKQRVLANAAIFIPLKSKT